MSHLHADTTNFSVAGQYDDGGLEPTGLHITFGHAKDKRTDLKRWALRMIVNAMGIPVVMKALDGNSSDKKTIIEGMKALKEVLQAEGMNEAAGTFIADSSFYTKDNIAAFTGKWISHARISLNEVKRYWRWRHCPSSIQRLKVQNIRAGLLLWRGCPAMGSCIQRTDVRPAGKDLAEGPGETAEGRQCKGLSPAGKDIQVRT
jgi:hypothetical protein